MDPHRREVINDLCSVFNPFNNLFHGNSEPDRVHIPVSVDTIINFFSLISSSTHLINDEMFDFIFYRIGLANRENIPQLLDIIKTREIKRKLAVHVKSWKYPFSEKTLVDCNGIVSIDDSETPLISLILKANKGSGNTITCTTTIMKLLENISECNISHCDKHGSNALIHACSKGMYDVAKIIFQHPHCNFNTVNTFGDSVLNWLFMADNNSLVSRSGPCHTKRLELLKSILDRPDLNPELVDKAFIQIFATRRYSSLHPDCVDVFMSKFFDRFILNHKAVHGLCESTIFLSHAIKVIEHPHCPINSLDNRENTILINAINCDNIVIAHKIISNPRFNLINHRESPLGSALTVLIYNLRISPSDTVRLFEKIIEHPYYDFSDFKLENIVMPVNHSEDFALKYLNVWLSRVSRDDINSRDYTQRIFSILEVVCHHKFKHVVDKFFECFDFDLLHVTPETVYKLFRTACSSNFENVALKIIESEYFILSEAFFRKPAIFIACFYNMPVVAEKVLEKTVNRCGFIEDNKSALVYACKYKMENVALRLAEFCDPFLSGDDSLSPYAYALDSNNMSRVVELFQTMLPPPAI